MIAWVGQSNRFGCGIAAAAMVAGKSYDDVLALLPAGWRVDEQRGLTLPYTLDQLLTELGYAVAPRWFHWAGTTRADWPPAPWADVHLCMVGWAAATHYVVLLRDGTVLDPLTPEPRRLGDYEQVMCVAAVVAVQPNQEIQS